MKKIELLTIRSMQECFIKYKSLVIDLTIEYSKDNKNKDSISRIENEMHRLQLQHYEFYIALIENNK